MDAICALKNEFGQRLGKRHCAVGSWSACNAAIPAAEACNGKDDDCDGKIDEEIAPLPCDVSNNWGVCSGKASCVDAKNICNAKEPAEESCNGIDDNCNTLVDEDLGTLPCGLGICKHQVNKCKGGKIATCDDPLAGAEKEVCNGVDDDCNGQIDELAEFSCGMGACKHQLAGCTAGKITACDANTGAKAEACNGIDDDCDGQTDEELPTSLCGVGQCEHIIAACKDGVSVICDAFAGQKDEACNGLDDDCNGKIDELWPSLGQACDGPQDADSCPGGVFTCAKGGVGVTCVGDGTFKTEACNGIDDDCNGKVDEAGAFGCVLYYQDGDGDGFGASNITPACQCQPSGIFTAASAGDCNDKAVGVSPGATETCNGIDDNCNGLVDEGVLTLFFLDQDGDGYGTPVSTSACAAPPGYTAKSGDCNDFNLAIHPGAPEQCNDIDDNCNGAADEGLVQSTLYTDLDGDGFGAKQGKAKKKCLDQGGEPPLGFALSNDDCNDSNAAIFPGAPELCDGILNNCNGAVKDYQCPVKCEGAWPIAIGAGPGHAAIVQLDADNEWEVVAYGSKGVFVVEHDGQIKWKGAAAGPYSYPGMADVNRDGWLDLVHHNGASIVALDGKTGNVLLNEATKSNGSSYPTGALGDVDGDGTPDVVTMDDGVLHEILLLDCKDCPGKVTVKKAIPLVAKLPAALYYSRPLLADLNGDGIPEIGMGTSGAANCKPGIDCFGQFQVFAADGSLFVDPLTYFSNGAAQTWGYHVSFPVFANLDGKGAPEIAIQAKQLADGGVTTGFSWAKDGTGLKALPGWSDSPILAPIQADGTLHPEGVLANAGGPVVDLDGDGIWETITAAPKGFVVKRGKDTMDGFPFGVASNGPIVVGDLQLDGRLDVIYLGNGNLNCYTLGAQTWGETRVLNFGTVDGLARSWLPTGQLDPYEPNDVRNKPFDPVTSKNPIKDSRAVWLAPFKNGFNANSGLWIRQVRGMLGDKGDRDFFWTRGPLEAPVLTMLSDKADYDMYMHIYTEIGGVPDQYVTTMKSTGNTLGEYLECHSCCCLKGDQAKYNGQSKLFIIEIRGKDETKDYGPWPYILSDFWGVD